jgi:hypothetical protein
MTGQLGGLLLEVTILSAAVLDAQREDSLPFAAVLALDTTLEHLAEAERSLRVAVAAAGGRP